MKGRGIVKESATHSLFSDSLAPLLDAAHIGLWKLCVGSGQVEFNNYLKRIAGIESSDSRQNLSTFMSLIHRDDAPWMAQLLSSCMAGTLHEFQKEHRIIRHDGCTLWVVNCCTVKDDTDKKPEYLSGILYDKNKEQIAHPGKVPDNWRFIANSGGYIMPGFSPEDISGFACQNKSRSVSGEHRL